MGDFSSSKFLILQQGWSATECIDCCSQRGLTGNITNGHLKTGARDLIRKRIICSLFCLKLSPNGWAIFLFTLTQADRSVRQLKMLTSFWEIIWHFSSTISLLQTDADGVSPPLWHKYLDPWYLTQAPRHCDIISYKEELETLRLSNRRALGYDCLWIVSVPMQIYRAEINKFILFPTE